MAYVSQAPGFSPADDPQLERRMRLAQMLRDQSLQGFGPTESFGGYAVKRSPLEGATKIVQALMASKLDKENEPALSKMAGKRAEQQAMIEQLQRLQLGQVQRQADIANLPGQFATPAGVAGADGTDAGAGMGGGTPTPAGFDAQGYAQALMAKDPTAGLDFQQRLQKPAVAPLVSKPGEVARDPKTGAILWQNPEAADGEKDAFLRVMKAAGVDPASPQGKAMLSSYLTKMSTHAPPVAINNAPYAPVMTVEGPDGPMAIQPGSRPGQAPSVVTNPATGKPAVPVKEGGGKVPAEIQRMNAAADTMSALLGDYEKWLKANNPRDPTVQMNPAGRASQQSLMKNIQLQFKELQALGALAGPDLALMEAALTDPFTFKGAYYGKDGLMGQINQAKRLIDVRRQAIAAQGGNGPQKAAAPAANSDPLGLR